MSERKSITTGVGDRGKTRLYSSEEVPKDSPRPEACGDLDELVSVLGIARCHVVNADAGEGVRWLQRKLFVVAAEVATTPVKLHSLAERIDEAALAEFDERRVAAERRVTVPEGFVLPGVTWGAAHLDHARAVARRAERRVVALYHAGLVENVRLLVWMNRLSDYLWLLARLEEGRPEMLRDG
jgi:cob(I)alamin adenosyltransferase